MSDFFQQLKLALPGFKVIDLSSISFQGMLNALDPIEQNTKLIGVIIRNPSNEILMRYMSTGTIIPNQDLANPFKVQYVMLHGNSTTSYGGGCTEEVIRKMKLFLQINIDNERSCLICYEKIKDSVRSLCHVCGDGPCNTCKTKMFEGGDFKCAKCRTPLVEI